MFVKMVITFPMPLFLQFRRLQQANRVLRLTNIAMPCPLAAPLGAGAPMLDGEPQVVARVSQNN